MELENIVANTVLLKAREGTAPPARSRPGPTLHPGSSPHAPALHHPPAPRAPAAPRTPPPPWAPWSPSVRGGGWPGGLVPVGIAEPPGGDGTAAPVLRDASVRLSHPPRRARDAGQRI